MSSGDIPFADRLARARQDAEFRGKLLVEYGERYLRRLAEQNLGADLGPHLSVADFLQETIHEANQGFGRFRGETEAELIGWLKTIFRNNIADKRRRRRLDVHGLGAGNSDGDGRGGRDPAAPDTSPSQYAIRGEQEDRLTLALSQLPERQRVAVTLRHLHGRHLGEIAIHLGCSHTAAAGLLKRGVDTLRRKLGEESSS